jgi:uncharacterized protein
MRALTAARAVDPPDWAIGAGALRDFVWDRLHGREPSAPKDVDLAFFDPADLSPEREEAVRDGLSASAPELNWDARNQAAVHLWYRERFGVEVEPLRSTADGIATWPEPASAVAVRLDDDDQIDVIAPHGLDDLFGLVWRRNPRRVTPEEYRRRTEAKDIRRRWPRVRVVE